MAKFMSTVKEKMNKAWGFVKENWGKAKNWIKNLTNWKVVWDKITTGILIFLMASPLLILGYILLWFVSK